jgi:hypothetical protein
LNNCLVCGGQFFAYVHHLQGYAKAGSYPVCVWHYVGAWVLQAWVQDPIRTYLAKSFGIRKGLIPRIKLGGRQP